MSLDTPLGPVLYLNGITVSFDGFKALDKLSLIVEPGELRCIIGPNGAGKTTLMDVVTGKTRPDQGEALFGEKADLTRMSETSIADAGIGRKFQKPTVFRNHTVFENLELAMKTGKGVFTTLGAKLSIAQRSRIDRSGRLADLVRELRIHKQGPPDHAMLAHQVFGRGHLRL